MRAENTPLGAQLFEAEQNDLMADLNDIPRKSVDRKVGGHALPNGVPSALSFCPGKDTNVCTSTFRQISSSH